MLPLHDSLKIFSQTTLAALRAKSIRLTDYLRFLIESLELPGIKIITPGEPDSFGCQLSLAVSNPRPTLEKIRGANVICDLREPDIYGWRLFLCITPLVMSGGLRILSGG